MSYLAIGGLINRSASTISRGVARNKNPVLRGYLAARLRDDWPPAQIAGRLTITYSPTWQMQISHDPIYKSLFIQARGVLPKHLQKHLHTHRPTRKARSNTTRG